LLTFGQPHDLKISLPRKVPFDLALLRSVKLLQCGEVRCVLRHDQNALRVKGR
jgi:hypothetical protein